MNGFRMTEEQVAAHNARVKSARKVTFNDERSKSDEPRKNAKRPKVEKPAKSPKKKWDYESRLAQQIEDAGISGFFVDVEYIEGRGLRADILFPPPVYLIVEIQGAAHRIKGKWQADIIKAQDTMLAGYRLLPISTSQVRDGTAADIIRKVLAL